MPSDRWGNFGDHNRHESDAPIGQASRFSYSVRDGQGFIVAHCTNPLITMSSDRSEANARLIAAAPELLSALTKMHHFLARIEGYLQENDLWDDEEQDLLEANVAAIAKATN